MKQNQCFYSKIEFLIFISNQTINIVNTMTIHMFVMYFLGMVNRRKDRNRLAILRFDYSLSFDKI
jgi:hypothetical protein